MTEKSRPPLIERVAKVGVLGGLLAGLQIIGAAVAAPFLAAAATIATVATLEVVAVGAGIGAAVGGIIYLIDRVTSTKSGSK